MALARVAAAHMTNILFIYFFYKIKIESLRLFASLLHLPFVYANEKQPPIGL